VLISDDKKNLIKLQEEKQFSTKVDNLTKIADLQKYALHHMNLIDKTSNNFKYRFNDWLWFYGQRIIEITREMGKPESDKKRLSNKRTKILTKMNKINEIDKIY
jgi:hypothetical protein